MSFTDYTTSILKAFKNHNKAAEIVKRKKEILTGVAEFHNYTPDSVLYVGFNPAILAETAKTIAVTCVSKEIQNFLNDYGIQFTVIAESDFPDYYKTFDSIVALDEYFTFAIDDQDQKNKVTQLCHLAKEYIITTCKDYKNQDFKDREFSIPALIRGSNDNKHVFLEFHDYDATDRNKWKTTLYEINNNQCNAVGPFARRALYFKQLAKFSHDADAVGFSVHKNLMYKSLLKKNYEHVISIRFDGNNGS